VKLLVIGFLCSIQISFAINGFIKEEAFPTLQFNRPIFMTSPNDQTDRLFLIEQGGLLKVFPNRESVNPSDVKIFLDIRSLMQAEGNEEGLLGLAFDPLYSKTGRFYVYYTKLNPRRSVLSRFQVSSTNPNQGNLLSEEIILEIPQPFANHNGGMLTFGPDGMLYIGTGDGGRGNDPLNNAQNTKSLLGKILRIDVSSQRSFKIPASNPFVQSMDGKRKEIFAYGLRNPWRFSFDFFTKELWVADVGQDSFEEINIVENGDNLGWKLYEGFQSHHNPFGVPPTSLKQPLFTYNPTQGSSITGGYVYRGDKLKSLYGYYVYTDFSSGRVWKLKKEQGRGTEVQEIENVPMPASFGQDAKGELYILSFTGKLFKLTEKLNTSIDQPILKLSETGLFTDLVNFKLTPNFVEYEVNMPLWSDGVIKRRFISIPNGSSIQTKGNWVFPLGTIIIKDFRQPTELGLGKRMETRVMKKTKSGWKFSSYKWNEAQTDAIYVSKPEMEEISVFNKESGETKTTSWMYPDSTTCLSCHTGASGRVLGVEERQVHRKNQMSDWISKGMISFNSNVKNLKKYPDYHSEVENTEEFARAYLDVNCSSCHQPQGPTPYNMDLRFTTKLEDMNLLGVDSADVSSSGLALKRLLKGDAENSVLFQRMNTTGGDRMPWIGTELIDEKAVIEIKKWIKSLK